MWRKKNLYIKYQKGKKDRRRWSWNTAEKKMYSITFIIHGVYWFWLSLIAKMRAMAMSAREKKVHLQKLLLLRHLWVTERPRSGQHKIHRPFRLMTGCCVLFNVCCCLRILSLFFFFEALISWPPAEHSWLMYALSDSLWIFYWRNFSIHCRYKSFARKSRSKAKKYIFICAYSKSEMKWNETEKTPLIVMNGWKLWQIIHHWAPWWECTIWKCPIDVWCFF